MRNKIVSLMVLANLIAITAQAAPAPSPTPAPAAKVVPGGNIPITYLPFNISTPGTYVLKSNMTYNNWNPIGPVVTPPITVSGVLTGPIVIDFKGFTITGTHNDVGIEAVRITSASSYPNNFPVTVQNGTVYLFVGGVSAKSTGNVTVKNMTISACGWGISFTDVFNSTVKNVDIVGPAPESEGIYDKSTGAGNTYDSVTFSKIDFPFYFADQDFDDRNLTLNFKPTPPAK